MRREATGPPKLGRLFFFVDAFGLSKTKRRTTKGGRSIRAASLRLALWSVAFSSNRLAAAPRWGPAEARRAARGRVAGGGTCSRALRQAGSTGAGAGRRPVLRG